MKKSSIKAHTTHCVCQNIDTGMLHRRGANKKELIKRALLTQLEKAQKSINEGLHNTFYQTQPMTLKIRKISLDVVVATGF